MTESSLIDLKEYGVDINSEPLEVAESRLYKGLDTDNKPVAIKIYKNLPIEQIIFYRDVTNKLANMYNSDEYLNIKFDGKSFRLLIYVVPIQQIGISENLPVSISPFIEGKTLFSVEPNYISSRFTNLSSEPLTALGARFRNEVGVDNISIIPWNVKPLLNENPMKIAITDVTGAVKDLRKR